MMNKWQPIETAPSNTPILVYADGGYFVAVYILDPYPHWKGRWFLEPTHWMPLPEPPK